MAIPQCFFTSTKGWMSSWIWSLFFCDFYIPWFWLLRAFFIWNVPHFKANVPQNAMYPKPNIIPWGEEAIVGESIGAFYWNAVAIHLLPHTRAAWSRLDRNHEPEIFTTWRFKKKLCLQLLVIWATSRFHPQHIWKPAVPPTPEMTTHFLWISSRLFTKKLLFSLSLASYLVCLHDFILLLALTQCLFKLSGMMGTLGWYPCQRSYPLWKEKKKNLPSAKGHSHELTHHFYCKCANISFNAAFWTLLHFLKSNLPGGAPHWTSWLGQIILLCFVETLPFIQRNNSM